jgi:NAD+ kinase
MQTKPFNTIGIVGRPDTNAQITDTLKLLIDYLNARKLNIIIEQYTADVLVEHALPICSPHELGELCDLVIVIGGDGSMLTAARALAKHQVPVVGINRGGLGFLTDIPPDQIEQKLDGVFAGEYTTESRFLLTATVQRSEGSDNCGQALNDVVLSTGQLSRMIEFELYINDQFVYSQRSNGLIVSTPTGSTAYALSGGGPIMHPDLDAIVLVPMFPHTLTARPIVVDGNSKIMIIPGTLHDASPQISCDSHTNFITAPNDKILIEKMSSTLTLIHPLQHDFYQACRSKLGWGSRLGN